MGISRPSLVVECLRGCAPVADKVAVDVISAGEVLEAGSGAGFMESVSLLSATTSEIVLGRGGLGTSEGARNVESDVG